MTNAFWFVTKILAEDSALMVKKMSHDERTIEKIDDDYGAWYIMYENRAIGSFKWPDKNVSAEFVINQWLAQNKKDILTAKERTYLETVIKPFRNKIFCIGKYANDLFSTPDAISIYFGMDNGKRFSLPPLDAKTYFTGMKLAKMYSLEELGL